jgi:hypothetical protein
MSSAAASESLIDVVSGKEVDALERHRSQTHSMLAVCPLRGYTARSLSPLIDASRRSGIAVEGLGVWGFSGDFSVAGLETLTGLRRLSLAGTSSTPDLSSLSELVELRATLDKRGLPALPRLEVASIEGFKGSDAAGLANAPNLKDLSLVRPLMTSLAGVEHLVSLQRISVYGATKLRSIASVSALRALTTLELEACKKVEDINQLRSGSLQRFILSNCGSIPNLRFVTDLPSLKTFTFVDTRIEDGDLSPVLHLEYVAFDDKRHYSHRYADLERARQRTEQ